MDFRPAHEIQNFGCGDRPGRLLLQLRRVNAAKQKNAANQAEGEERRHVESRLAENSGVVFQAHGCASSATDDPNNAEQQQRVADPALPLVLKACLRARLASLLGAVGGYALLSGCAGAQSALDPHSEQADTVAVLFWTFTAILGFVWLLTMAGLLLALTRRRDGRGESAEVRPAVKRPMIVAFAGMLALSAIVLSGLAVLSFRGQRTIFGSGAGAVLTISVIGHQWWWQVRYEGDNGFETANEIRIPVGSPVDIKLMTADVIHSFWIPSLAGKLDLIPGKSNELRIEASKPGVYRGQCAEFCGQQHAHMAIFVVALQPHEFERWRIGQAAPAKPTAFLTKQRVFTSALLESSQ
ncbi:cytochrome c oxidase subunit II [Mesorhizobium sp. ORS 3428]|uniref:cytochrome c oxidase subunit II n=1 Tax=Mesorhizobium sp. ORS 3428 TaxID=540997 RepID=UPI0008D90E1E|nr:cytochrome c oxidase subunit II [Mesorhizobium sp. ORS 3428]OHV87364.1 cytochrome c oxidase subunit II [Mesorhizobium sp. ORS 3428]